MVFIHNRKSASDRFCKMSIMCDSNQCLSCPPVIVVDYYAVNFIKLNLLISLYNPSSDD